VARVILARAGVSFRWRRFAAIAGLAALMVVEIPAAASAQNIFETLFGGFRRAMTPRAPAVANHADGHGGGASSGYCVRLCDGRYFPVSGRGRMNAAEMCRAFCPMAQTTLFSGGNIANATAPGGLRYSNLPNAFVYREKIVADCSCNGKSPLGLVPFEETDDPTLRTGDIVATQNGLMSYRNDSGHAEFVPASSTPGLSAKLKEQLTQTRVAPEQSEAPEAATDGRATSAPATPVRNIDHRAQAAQ
jgi:hypothetical protein